MDIMAYLTNAFGQGETSYIIFVQAFGAASPVDLHNFWIALNAESQDEQDAFFAIAASVNFAVPPDDDPTGETVHAPTV